MTEAQLVKDTEVLESYHTVTSYEMDSFGHVNNAVFLNYLEKARCDFMTLKGLRFNDFFKWHRYPVVVEAHLVYKYPAKAGDNLVIKGWISLRSQASFTMQYRVFNRDSGQLVLSGETRHVFLDDHNRPSRIPGEFAEKFLHQ